MVHHRVINWSDTDAAQIVYTVRFLDFAMEAIEEWFRTVIGRDWYDMNMNLGIGTPFVKTDIDFRAPLTPRDALYITVLVEYAGYSSIAFNVTGDRGDGLRSFEGRMVCCAVEKKGAMKPVEIPAEWRGHIDRYVARCAANETEPNEQTDPPEPGLYGDVERVVN